MDKSIWYVICKYKDIKHDKYKHKTISVFPIYLLEHPRRHLGYIALNKESVRAIMSVICLGKEMSLFGFCVSHQKVTSIYQSNKKKIGIESGQRYFIPIAGCIIDFWFGLNIHKSSKTVLKLQKIKIQQILCKLSASCRLISGFDLANVKMGAFKSFNQILWRQIWWKLQKMKIQQILCK